MDQQISMISADTIRELGFLGLAVLALVGFARRWWYFAWQYNDAVANGEKAINALREKCTEISRDRDFWRDHALTGKQVTREAIATARIATEKL